MENARQHWEHIYQTRSPNEVSWTQRVPTVSLDYFHTLDIPKNASIIDVGGGDSNLVDFLIEEGYTNLTVLDISQASLDRAKKRLGDKANLVKWVVSDILDFNPSEQYDVWHDRAAFHFQTNANDIKKYLEIVNQHSKGIVIVGTFSTEGPLKCSGLTIQQYNEDSMKGLFEKNGFENIECKREDHVTPAGAVQNFVFCSFKKN